MQGVRLEITEGKVGVGENGGQEKGRRGAQGAGLESTEAKGGGVESTFARGEVGDHGGQGERWRERRVREGEAWSARGGVGEHGGQEREREGEAGGVESTEGWRVRRAKG